MASLRLPIKPAAFLQMGLRMAGVSEGRQASASNMRHYRSYFHITPSHSSILWAKMLQKKCLPAGARPIHMLWGLLFLNVYTTEQILADIANVDPKTYRYWATALVKSIAKLKPEYVSVQ